MRRQIRRCNCFPCPEDYFSNISKEKSVTGTSTFTSTFLVSHVDEISESTVTKAQYLPGNTFAKSNEPLGETSCEYAKGKESGSMLQRITLHPSGNVDPLETTTLPLTENAGWVGIINLKSGLI